jgi:hypothetical protein
MTRKSYAINTSLLRIGVLAAQIAVSPSAAAQWRDFLVGEGNRLVDLVRNLPYLGNDHIVRTCSKRAMRCASGLRPPPEEAVVSLPLQTDTPAMAIQSSRGILEDEKWEMQ